MGSFIKFIWRSKHQRTVQSKKEEVDMHKKVIKSLFILVLAILFSAGTVIAAEPVKIGVIYPLTGPNFHCTLALKFFISAA